MEIRFNMPVLCATFWLDPSMGSRFIAILLSVQKDEEQEEKNEEI